MEKKDKEKIDKEKTEKKEDKEKIEDKEKNDDATKLPIENDIRVVIESKEDGVLFDQDCCTVINIILNNDKEIATSFLGVHNEEIIKHLIKAQKVYFKALKKTLKEERHHAKEIVDNEEDEVKEENKKEKKSEEYIHHIKEYQPIDKNVIKENSEDSDKNQAQEQKPKVVKSDTEEFEHICDENGCRLVKKKINPKDAPSTSQKSSNKSKSTNKNTTKSK